MAESILKQPGDEGYDPVLQEHLRVRMDAMFKDMWEYPYGKPAPDPYDGLREWVARIGLPKVTPRTQS